MEKKNFDLLVNGVAGVLSKAKEFHTKTSLFQQFSDFKPVPDVSATELVEDRKILNLVTPIRSYAVTVEKVTIADSYRLNVEDDYISQESNIDFSTFIGSDENKIVVTKDGKQSCLFIHRNYEKITNDSDLLNCAYLMMAELVDMENSELIGISNIRLPIVFKGSLGILTKLDDDGNLNIEIFDGSLLLIGFIRGIKRNFL